MQFDKQVQDKIDLLDTVFSELEVPLPFENNDFLVEEISNNGFLRLKLCESERNLISMEICLSLFGIQINVDRESEVYEWSNKHIEKERENVISFIKQVLTSFVMVEYCGSHYTAFSFFDQNGTFLFKTPIISGFYFKYKCKKKLYFPIYPQYTVN